MHEHKIVKAVLEAQQSSQKADRLIKEYIPFIRSEASKAISRLCTPQDDEYSIAMIAFHEAILGFDKGRGSFLGYAALVIRSRIADYQRKEARHRGSISLYTENEEEGTTLMDTIADSRNEAEENAGLEATKQEIAELAAVMAQFGVSFTDVAENCPRQQRTMEACSRAISYGAQNRELLDNLLKTKKLPMAQLTEGSGAERKTLERHRKYILAMLLIYTNGYEIIRGHIRHIVKGKGGISV